MVSSTWRTATSRLARRTIPYHGRQGPGRGSIPTTVTGRPSGTRTFFQATDGGRLGRYRMSQHLALYEIIAGYVARHPPGKQSFFRTSRGEMLSC